MGVNLIGKPFYLNEKEVSWVQNTLASLTIKQKVGQLFCLMAGDYSEEQLKELVSIYNIGGLLYRPIHDKEELKGFFKELDAVSNVPLLKAANLEEGGNGAYADGTRFANQEGVAAANKLEVVTKFAKVCAKEGLEAGVNWTFSPVSDIDMNFMNPITNLRTFGNNAETVKKCTREYVKTVQACGMAACAKHFPGDGVDFRDQHLHPTYNTLSAKEWYETYGSVYQNMIEEDLLSIMVGHICQPAVQREMNPSLTDEEIMPATLSPELLKGVLREKFGFNGVITTDATIMGGYCMAMERKKAVPATVAFGCDMLVFTTDIYEDYQSMLDGLESGILTEERLDEAVTRILALKAKVALNPVVTEDTPDDFVASREEIKTWIEECADLSVVLEKNKRNIVPVANGKYKKVKLVALGKNETADGKLTDLVTEYLQKEGLEVELYDPFADDFHGSNALDKEQLTLYICNMEAESNKTTVRIFWCPKHALEIPRFVNEEDCIFISFGNPYHLQDMPRVPVYINAFTAGKANVNAALDKVFGKSEFKGVSSVDAFCGLMDTRL